MQEDKGPEENKLTSKYTSSSNIIPKSSESEEEGTSSSDEDDGKKVNLPYAYGCLILVVLI